MNIFEAHDLHAGGQGSGCNPAAGKCGRHPTMKDVDRAGGTQTTSSFFNKYNKSVATKVLDSHTFTSSQTPKTETVALADLHPTQRTVSNPTTAHLAKNGYKDLPDVFRQDGKLWIIDGHHRLASDVVNGKTHVKVDIIDADPKKE